MNAPYDESTVASLMVKQKLTRSHAVGEAIWSSADRALRGALTLKAGLLPNILTENKTKKTWPIRPASPIA
jgi:hypothetical protein